MQNPRKLAKLRPLLLPLGIIALCLLLQALQLEDAIRFDRERIGKGEWWLLLSANFVHLGWSHWALNMAGLALILLLFGEHFSLLEWLALIFIDSLLLAVSLYFWDLDLFWYVGFSGTLHGMYAAGLIPEWQRSRGFCVLLASALLAKLIWEQVFGALPGTAEAAGGPVVVDAHLYGAAWGFALAFIYIFVRKKLYSQGYWVKRSRRS